MSMFNLELPEEHPIWKMDGNYVHLISELAAKDKLLAEANSFIKFYQGVHREQKESIVEKDKLLAEHEKSIDHHSAGWNDAILKIKELSDKIQMLENNK